MYRPERAEAPGRDHGLAAAPAAVADERDVFADVLAELHQAAVTGLLEQVEAFGCTHPPCVTVPDQGAGGPAEGHAIVERGAAGVPDVLHLVPAYPLDCGKMIRSAFARTHGYGPAGRAASGLGQALALIALLGGIVLHNPWISLAGLFIFIGAQIEDQGIFFQTVVDTVHMREVMLTDFATLSPSDTLADALGRCVHSLQEDFPVVRGPQLVGIVSRQRIVDALRNDGNGYVQSVMSRAFQVACPDDTLGTTIRRLTAGHGLALIPITESGRVVGIVSVQNLMSSMSLLAEKRRLEREEARD